MTCQHLFRQCLQATGHKLDQDWSRSLMPYGITGPQWVNTMFPLKIKTPCKLRCNLSLYDCCLTDHKFCTCTQQCLCELICGYNSCSWDDRKIHFHEIEIKICRGFIKPVPGEFLTIHPAVHWQVPCSESHWAPFWHIHVCRHCSPWVPAGHASSQLQGWGQGQCWLTHWGQWRLYVSAN